MTFQDQILEGIPEKLPQIKAYDTSINHAPKRKAILSVEEKKLALRNALRYFEPKHHAELLPEFKNELETCGRIYMYRFRPDYKMHARPIDEYPAKIKHAAIYVGNMGSGDICYVAEAVGRGVVLTDLVTFMTTKDIIIGCKPKFIREDVSGFIYAIHQATRGSIGKPYDYLFNRDGKAFYCFELVAMCLKSAYPELQLKCKEIVKGKRIYDENTFLDPNFFTIIFDSRNE